MSEDPVDDMELGETAEVSHTWECSVWGKADNDYVGRDREISDLTVDDAYVVDEDGNESIELVVSADVTKVDPDTKPFFQSEDRWERRQQADTKTVDSRVGVAALKTAPYAITAGTFGVVMFVADRVFEQADMTINGQPLAAPGFLEIAPIFFLALFLMWAIQYLPGTMRGSR